MLVYSNFFFKKRYTFYVKVEYFLAIRALRNLNHLYKKRYQFGMYKKLALKLYFRAIILIIRNVDMIILWWPYLGNSKIDFYVQKKYNVQLCINHALGKSSTPSKTKANSELIYSSWFSISIASFWAKILFHTWISIKYDGFCLLLLQ